MIICVALHRSSPTPGPSGHQRVSVFDAPDDSDAEPEPPRVWPPPRPDTSRRRRAARRARCDFIDDEAGASDDSESDADDDDDTHDFIVPDSVEY